MTMPTTNREAIMEMNKEFNLHRYREDSVDTPITKEGKEFWCVGMNATTAFYAGVSPDDQLFEFSHDCDEGESAVKPVDDPTGVYWGHF